jgi:hypothetical protein
METSRPARLLNASGPVFIGCGRWTSGCVIDSAIADLAFAIDRAIRGFDPLKKM